MQTRQLREAYIITLPANYYHNHESSELHDLDSISLGGSEVVKLIFHLKPLQKVFLLMKYLLLLIRILVKPYVLVLKLWQSI